MWSVQDKMLSKCITKNLTDSVIERFWLSSIIFRVWVKSFSQWKVNCKCFMLIQYKLVYLKPFRNELKDYIYFFCKSLQLVDVTVILVSSAYNTVHKRLSIIFGRLYKLNSIGPRMQPWGTPHFADSQSVWKQWVAAQSKDTPCLLSLQ